MEMEEIQSQGCKFPRLSNGSSRSKGADGKYHPDDVGDGLLAKRNSVAGLGGGNDILAGNRLCGWPSSRIVRVSRASGGKDRHSKVWTSKGLRDRRVRLSVTTAIQFYDLQDRLGCDQPSKAVEWLLKAAATSIAELPSLNSLFPDTPKQLSDKKRYSGGTDQHGFESAEMEMDGDPNYQHQQQNVSLSKSACSSTSETSKGSGLSLSRSENRIKARERARERAAEKEKEKDHHQNVNHSVTQNSSFTELLTGGISSVSNHPISPNGSAHHTPGGGGESHLFHKSRQWSASTAPMDYFGGLLGQSSSRANHTTGFSSQIQLGNTLPQFNVGGVHHQQHQHHQELQHFSFVPDHLVPVATAAAGGSDLHNLNFSIFNRGTLQSNSPSLLPHIQRFPPIDGSSLPFFIGTAAPNAAAPVDNHQHNHQFPSGFEGRLQLYYGDGNRHSDQKGKGKN